ncbi:hypothetical protein V8E36_004259 [Tilletia maclaganii]
MGAMVKASFRLPLNLGWPGLSFTLSSDQVELRGDQLAHKKDSKHAHSRNWAQHAAVGCQPGALEHARILSESGLVPVHLTNDTLNSVRKTAVNAEPTVKDAVVVRSPYSILQILPSLVPNFESTYRGAPGHLKIFMEHDVPKNKRLSADHLVDDLRKIVGKRINREPIESAWRTTLTVDDRADKQCPNGIVASLCLDSDNLPMRPDLSGHGLGDVFVHGSMGIKTARVWISAGEREQASFFVAVRVAGQVSRVAITNLHHCGEDDGKQDSYAGLPLIMYNAFGYRHMVETRPRLQRSEMRHDNEPNISKDSEYED